jgi:hypothetical protein
VGLDIIQADENMNEVLEAIELDSKVIVARFGLFSE